MSPVWLLSLLFPIVLRLYLIAWFPKYMRNSMTPEEKDRATHRGLLTPMLGFSFTALLGLALADNKLDMDLEIPVCLLFLSFLCYLAALNLQGYKDYKWHDVVGDLLMETASLALILSITYVITIKTQEGLVIWLSLLAGAVWLIDFMARYINSWEVLSTKEKYDVQ